ncbi:hypothetical protein FACS189488_14600 [Betaproteobacteria bacterium]|nr:hypothetical protein FACS189488_14600 [Betaproteobacteria bacterium]
MDLNPTTAAGTAQNAAVNNFLTHDQIAEYSNCVAEKGAEACEGVRQRLNEIDRITNDQLDKSCSGGDTYRCRAQLESAYKFLSDVQFKNPEILGHFASNFDATKVVFDKYVDQYYQSVPGPLAQLQLDHPTTFGSLRIVGGGAGYCRWCGSLLWNRRLGMPDRGCGRFVWC